MLVFHGEKQIPHHLLQPSSHTLPTTLFCSQIQLSWFGTPHIQKSRFYRIEIAMDSAFQFGNVDSLLVDTTHTWTSIGNYEGRFWWHVRAFNAAGWGPFSETRMFVLSPCGVEEGHEIPSAFVLAQNFPNPFNPTTMIRFGLPAASAVTLVVYNTLGEEIRTLVNDNLAAGYHVVAFDVSGFPSGLYFYRMRAADPSASSGQSFVETKKLLLVR